MLKFKHFFQVGIIVLIPFISFSQQSVSSDEKNNLSIELQLGWGASNQFNKHLLSNTTAPNFLQTFMSFEKNHLEYDLSNEAYPRIAKNKFFLNHNMGIFVSLGTWKLKQDTSKVLSVSLLYHDPLWWDVFEPSTAPILNQGYMYGGDIKILIRRRYGKTERFLIKNFMINFLLAHESTHIGDELTIHRERMNFPITRVNVTRNFSELSFSINALENIQNENLTIKLGVLFNFSNFPDSLQGNWPLYYPQTHEADPLLFNPSKKQFEFFLQAQYQSKIGFIGKHWQLLASMELRSRLQHGYPFIEPGVSKNAWKLKEVEERNTLNVNTFIGLGIIPNISQPVRLSAGLRAYYGINPHGQFRNLPKHYSIGFGFNIEWNNNFQIRQSK